MKTKLIRIIVLSTLILFGVYRGHSQNIPINLDQGWNWIGYTCSEPMTIKEALAGFTPSEGDVLQSKTKNSKYTQGRWRGSLTTLEPGKGYMYKSVNGESISFVFGGAANDPSALPEEALDGEFTVASNGTKVRFSPGNLQCRIDPTHVTEATLGTGTSTINYMPYYTYYRYSLCQMIYKAEELRAAGLGFGTLTSIAFESYSTYHYQRDGITVWVSNTTLTAAPSTSVVTSDMTQVFSGSLVQQEGWTTIPFSTSFSWDGESNLMVTVVMNHGNYDSSTLWQCSKPGFTCCSYKNNDSSPYYPGTTTYSMYTSANRPNTRFNSKGGIIWRFAERQMDYIGANNAYTSSSYNGWIDLFGWGTSGHLHGATCYQPWSTSQTNSDYYAYGGDGYNLNDQTGEADWGCNPISHGGDQPNQWRTLTKDEWVYMVNTRSTTSGKRYAKATVDGVNGLILLPDNWSTSYYTLNSTNSNAANFSSNVISASDWNTLEQHGAVFLPAAGNRGGNEVNNVGNSGQYWSSSYNNNSYAHYLLFGDQNLNPSYYYNRWGGRSVRLVCQSNPRIRAIGMSNVTNTSATVNAEVDFTGTVSTRGVCWNTTGAPTVEDTYYYAGTGKGSYTAPMTDLQANATYYVRAYAKIGNTYHYGNTLTFTTSGQLTVSTAEVTSITGTFAQCGGTVTGGGQGVTARGLCWNLSGSPTVDDNHTCEGRGEGCFSSLMDNLTESSYYHVRAYATTAEGTVYGNEREFLASNVLQVTTATVTNVTYNSATCGGTVNNNGGSNTIIARGVCTGTSSSPTITGNHTINGSGSGSFTVHFTGLAPGTTYYVRAYATTADGTTTYGSQRSFTTTAPPGAINGLFSVSASQQVFFSQGNLQYKASTNNWRFATNQYDYVGDPNSNLSASYNGYIDLFGWGTSGYNHGAVCYQPWSSSETSSDYYAYGNYTYNLYDQTGKADWGYNAISNGGNQTNQWRTLTTDEWAYVFNTRSTSSGIRYAKATVSLVNGVILLPDNWSASYYPLSNANTSNASFNSNVISGTQWDILEQHGAVFLPAAGGRTGTLVGDVGNFGYYWSAKGNGSFDANLVMFYDSNISPTVGTSRRRGLSVRLVFVAE
jgi:hypothetical protein